MLGVQERGFDKDVAMTVGPETLFLSVVHLVEGE